MSEAGRELPELVVHGRTTPYSYTCNRCMRCCRDNRIIVNPYEVFRLARNRGVSTTEFLARYVGSGGNELNRTDDDNACVFLTADGCSVHADRPLVCRVYPLGRQIDDDGVEEFFDLEAAEGSSGVYGTQSTVGNYVDGQGIGPYAKAFDAYIGVVDRLVATVATHADSDPAAGDALSAAAKGSDAGDPIEVPELLDIDIVLSQYCCERGLAVPTDAAEAMRLHIEAVDHRRLSDVPSRRGLLEKLAATAGVLGIAVGFDPESLSLQMPSATSEAPAPGGDAAPSE